MCLGLDWMVVALHQQDQCQRRRDQNRQCRTCAPCLFVERKDTRRSAAPSAAATPNQLVACVGDAAASDNLKAPPLPPTPPAETLPPTPPAATQTLRDRDELDTLDALPLDDDFHSADEFSSGHSSVLGATIDDNDGSAALDDDAAETQFLMLTTNVAVASVALNVVSVLGVGFSNQCGMPGRWDHIFFNRPHILGIQKKGRLMKKDMHSETVEISISAF